MAHAGLEPATFALLNIYKIFGLFNCNVIWLLLQVIWIPLFNVCFRTQEIESHC